MAGISSKAANTLQNKNKFNSGNELQSGEFSDGSGLETYDAHYRMLDPQLGRFWQVDPLAGATMGFSPFAFGNNNPISINDPFGLVGDSTDSKGNVWKGLQDVTVTSHPKRNQGGNYLGAFANGYSKKEQDRDRGFQNMYYYRKVNQTATIRGWDSDEYKKHAKTYQQWDVAQQDSKKMSVGAILLIASPIILTQAGFVLSEYGGETLIESLTGKELSGLISQEQRILIRKIFGNNMKGALENLGKEEIPEGLMKETVEIYREIAKKAINAGIDKGVQEMRLKIIESILKQFK